MNQRIEPATFNLKQTAQYLGIGVSTLTSGLRSGQIAIPLKEVNSRYIISKKDVDEWLASSHGNINYKARSW